VRKNQRSSGEQASRHKLVFSLAIVIARLLRADRRGDGAFLPTPNCGNDEHKRVQAGSSPEGAMAKQKNPIPF